MAYWAALDEATSAAEGEARLRGGEIRYVCGHTTNNAGAGAAVPHAFAAAGIETLRLLHTASPAGVEGFHVAVGGAGPP